ncbi:LiaF transmembrane domain-containing protein [Clostridium paraputrificum]|uniref:LiaF transmembrane domain-containing protein n=1 Tax=Clostridium TaxID=1485 RepID=UPI003D34B540
MKNKNYFWGLLLVAIGVLGILSRIFNIHIFRPWEMWPLFILIPGLFFEFAYFSSKKNPGLLVPGGILTTIGCLFIFEILTRWRLSAYTWPIYILAVAIGLFQLYWFGGKEKGLLIPVGILTSVAVVSFWSMVFGNIFTWMNRSIVAPLILVVIGICILFKKDKTSS